MAAERKGGAIVTGSDSGIGRATAVALGAAGYDVGITWRRDEKGAEEAAREVAQGGRASVVRRLDLNEQGDVGGIVRELAEEIGGLDVFVNNAGTGASTPFLELELGEWEQVIRVDLTGAFLAGQAAAKIMVEAGRPGRIVNVTSVHEHVPKAEAAAYCAAKGGMGLLTKVMALELAEHGITVNSIAPGEISTPMTGQPDTDPETEDRPAIPMGRPGSAHEIAAAIVHLASPEASYTTGASLVVDGGLMLMAAQANQLIT